MEKAREDTLPLYESMLDWVRSSVDSSGAPGTYRKVHDAGRVEFPEPKGLEPDVGIFSSLRTSRIAESFVAIVPDGYLCVGGDNHHGAVLTSERELIWDVSPDGDAGRFQDHWIFGQTDFPPLTVVPETVGVVAIRPNWSVSYFHWMFQVLPRIHLLRESGIPIDKYVMNSRRWQFQHDTLATLGVDEAGIIDVGDRFHLRARELAVPSLVSPIVPAWVCAFLKSEFLDTASSRGKDRLYVGRASVTSGRKMVNEDQVKEVLTKFKFKEFVPDQMSVAEQAESFASASVIAAPHGGALTNLVFCPPGTKVVEFFAPTYVQPQYWILSGQCKLEHYHLIGRGEPSETWSAWPEDAPGSDPIDVDVDQLAELLANAGL